MSAIQTKRLTTPACSIQAADTHHSQPVKSESEGFKRRALCTALVAVLGGWQSPALAQGRTDTLAITGQSAPGTRGGTFTSFSAPVINHSGQFAFQGFMNGGSSTGGIFSGAEGSALTPVALEGQTAAGAGTGRFSAFSNLVLNDSGQTAFFARITGGGITQGIYRSSSGSALTAIALQSQIAAGAGGGTFSFFSSPVLNNSGQTAFEVSIGGQISSTGGGIYRSDSGGTLSAIALQGQGSNGAGSRTFLSFGPPVLNDSGQTAFATSFAGLPSGGGIYRSDSGGALTAIALQGQSAAGTSSFFSRFTKPVLNSIGQIAFKADLTKASRDDASEGVFISGGDGGAPTAVAAQGQIATGAGGGTFALLSGPTLNNSGQTAFAATITGGSSNEGIYRSSGSALTVLALQGQSATGSGGGTFSTFNFRAPVLSDGGQAAFKAKIAGISSTEGLFIGDGQESIAVQLAGKTLAGKTVESVNAPIEGSFNSFGQLAYQASFTDGGSGNFLFTPDLRWRQAISGAWDTAANWTLGLAPAFVHAIKIDPTVSLTVTGSKEAQSVKSLTVGGGNGIATLRLAGGTLTSESAVQIASTGVLTGDGAIVGGVSNSGTVRADNLRIDGVLSNSGRIVGHGRITADLAQTTAGQLRVGAGESMLLSGTAHSNAGTVEVRNGGELEVNGALNQTASGRTLLDNATVRLNDGLTNAGQMNVGFGGASVFGNVVNAAGGKVIVSGNSQATFYDTVEAKAGSELRISAGSTALFFGQVLQRNGSAFTGTGTKFYEGGLSVGNSPGAATDEGSVNFGSGNLYLAEIGGTQAGTGFDYYNVAGNLNFGGTLKLVSYGAFTGQAGQTFDLFDWGTSSGTFATIDSTGFNLAAGTRLDTSHLYQNGTISVTAVPEPETYALLLAGLGLMGAAVRRRNAKL
ncbi:PEP-CTERM protein-sorting domain [Comamonadaceae bacterium]